MLKAGDCDGAITKFQSASAAAPQWHEPFDNMAFCLYEQGKTAEAIAQWRHALELWGDSPDANAGLGMALYATGEQEEGRSKYAAAAVKDKGYQDEGYLRGTRFWSEKAIADSRPLR